MNGRDATPEDSYRNTKDAVARRRIQTAVVEACRERVARVVRRLVPPKHRVEAEHVGLIGVLVALEKFDPSRGVPFWLYAVQWVRKEVQRWYGIGVRWRKDVAQHPEHAYPAEYLDSVDDVELVEEMVATAEGLMLLECFLDTLCPADRHLLVCEKRDRGNANNARTRRYQSLVERATAFVRGSNDNEHREPVCGDRDAPRASGSDSPGRGAAR